MKFLFLVITLFSLNALTQELSIQDRIEYIYSNGRGTGFCDGSPTSWFCYDQIKDRAKQDAVQSAYYTCSGRKGQLDRYSASCNYFCTPFSLPADSLTQFVQCSSNCSLRCEIEDEN